MINELFLQESNTDIAQGQLSRVSVEELLTQLQITQTELENVRVSYSPKYSYFHCSELSTTII